MDPSSMDIFELQLRKGGTSRTLKFRSHNADSDKAPSIQAMELEMLQSEQAKGGSHQAVTTWLSRGLKVEAAQISLRRDIVKTRIGLLAKTPETRSSLGHGTWPQLMCCALVAVRVPEVGRGRGGASEQGGSSDDGQDK